MKNSTQIQEIIKKPLEERTDQELSISNILLQRDLNKKLNSIQGYVQFFFWISIASLVMGVLAYIISEST